MRTLFIAFFVGICCFLSACDVRTGSDQEPIIINWAEPMELPEEVYLGNIEKQKETVTLKLDPAETHKHVGVSHLEQGKLDEAIVAFKKAIQINPRFVEAYYLLADVYSIKGEGVLSRKSLDQAMALDGSYIIDICDVVVTDHKPAASIEFTIKSTDTIKLPPGFDPGPIKMDIPHK